MSLPTVLFSYSAVKLYTVFVENHFINDFNQMFSSLWCNLKLLTQLLWLYLKTNVLFIHLIQLATFADFVSPFLEECPTSGYSVVALSSVLFCVKYNNMTLFMNITLKSSRDYEYEHHDNICKEILNLLLQDIYYYS